MKLSSLTSWDFWETCTSSEFLSFLLPSISKLDPLSTSISANELSFKSESSWSVSWINYSLLTCWFKTSSSGLEWLIEDIDWSFSAIGYSSAVRFENALTKEKPIGFASPDPTISFFWLLSMKLISFSSGSTIDVSKAYVYTCVCKVGSVWLLLTAYWEANLRKRLVYYFRFFYYVFSSSIDASADFFSSSCIFRRRFDETSFSRNWGYN